MQVTIDKETVELLKCINASQNALEILINVMLIVGIEKFVLADVLVEKENKKTELIAKILSLKTNNVSRLLEMLNND